MDPVHELLRSSPLLKFVPEDRQAKLAALFTRERFDFGDLIVREGEPADAFYLLETGRARVIKQNGKGDELVLASLRPGSEFGDSALLEGGVRNASVRCSTAVEVLRLGRDDFLALVGQYPELRAHLEMTARYKALHGFLYEFSNFGRLSAAALRELVEKLAPVEFAKGQLHLARGRAGRADVHRADRAGADLCGG